MAGTSPGHPCSVVLSRLVQRRLLLRAAAACDRGRLLHGGDAALDRLLHLLERANFDLTHALARDAELGGQLLERDWIVGQAARLEDAPLALVEHVERGDQRLVAVVALLALGEDALLARRIVDQPVHPLAAFAVVTDRRV